MKEILSFWIHFKMGYKVCFLPGLTPRNGSEGGLRPKLYDKRDDSYFPIVNFPFMSSNNPAAPAYGVCISHLIRYSMACASYQDFMDRGLQLTRNLLSQGFLRER